MKLCAHCGDLFDHGDVCEHDLTQLIDWSTTSVGISLPTDQQDSNWVAAIRAPEIGRVLCGRYVLGQQIGAGGFGVVFAAGDRRLGKQVAVKVLTPHLARNDAAVVRFRREALAASAVRHENVVVVTDFDVDADGTQLIVMEYLDGVDLSKTLRKERALSPPRALYIASQVASALDATHRAGILHRDLKPANIYLTATESRSDFVKIIDFGLSKVTRDDSLTGSGVMGTPHYMSYEQARNRELDGRTDVYSLGVILYEMLVGEPPYLGRSALEVLTRASEYPPTPLSVARPDLELPSGLDELVLRALERDRAARYPTMEEFGGRINDWLGRVDPILAVSSPAIRRMVTAVPVPVPVPEPVPEPVPVPSWADPSTLDDSTGEIERALVSTGAAPPPALKAPAAVVVSAACALMVAAMIFGRDVTPTRDDPVRPRSVAAEVSSPIPDRTDPPMSAATVAIETTGRQLARIRPLPSVRRRVTAKRLAVKPPPVSIQRRPARPLPKKKQPPPPAEAKPPAGPRPQQYREW